MAEILLPGSPTDHPDSLVGDKLAVDLDGLFRQSRYWLRIFKHEPIVRDKSQKVRIGDYLLLETDRSQFPRIDRFDERLCVVRQPKSDPPESKLAEVTYVAGSPEDGPHRLEVDTFDLAPEVLHRIVFDRQTNGEIRGYEGYFRRVGGSDTGLVRLRMEELDYPSLKIRDTDIVAVCLLLVRGGQP